MRGKPGGSRSHTLSACGRKLIDPPVGRLTGGLCLWILPRTFCNTPIGAALTHRPLTREELLQRGTCCHMGCQNCPYGDDTETTTGDMVGSELRSLAEGVLPLVVVTIGGLAMWLKEHTQ